MLRISFPLSLFHIVEYNFRKAEKIQIFQTCILFDAPMIFLFQSFFLIQLTPDNSNPR